MMRFVAALCIHAVRCGKDSFDSIHNCEAWSFPAKFVNKPNGKGLNVHN